MVIEILLSIMPDCLCVIPVLDLRLAGLLAIFGFAKPLAWLQTKMVPLEGLEPTTPSLRMMCSTS
jgi:hypothetical protein